MEQTITEGLWGKTDRNAVVWSRACAAVAMRRSVLYCCVAVALCVSMERGGGGATELI